MTKFVAFMIAVASLNSANAFAQGHAARTRASNIPNSDQVMTFSDEIVHGGIVESGQSTVRGNRPMQGITLLRVRQHFVQEMLKSVENF